MPSKIGDMDLSTASLRSTSSSQVQHAHKRNILTEDLLASPSQVQQAHWKKTLTEEQIN
jgi:hypothetical protein